MTPDDLIAHYKTQTAAAKALGIRQSSVARWVAAKAIPRLRQFHIEDATGRALLADRREPARNV